MFNKDALKAEFKRNGLLQEDVASLLEISKKSLSNRLRDGEFRRSEIEVLTRELEIPDPMYVFFYDFARE